MNLGVPKFKTKQTKNNKNFGNTPNNRGIALEALTCSIFNLCSEGSEVAISACPLHPLNVP